MKFDCVGSWSLPFYLHCMSFSVLRFYSIYFILITPTPHRTCKRILEDADVAIHGHIEWNNRTNNESCHSL